VFDISNLPGTLREKIDSFKDSIKKVYSKSKASVPSFKFYLNDKFIGSMDHIGNVYKENFADGKKKVQEAFDNPYPITWEYLEPTGPSSAIGKVEDGSALDIHISEDPDGIYEIEFARGQSDKNMGRSGQGDEFRIFATVQTAMIEWWNQLDKASAKKITFYANKEDGNRSRLYKRFLKIWGDKSEWDIEVNGNVKPGLLAYSLTNPTSDEPKNDRKTFMQRIFGKKETVENFADGKKKVQEAFDTQIDWEEDSDMFSSDGEAYKANIGYKEVGIQYYFEVVDAGGFPLSGVDVTFEVNGTTKKTGGGDASTIFGAVVNHIKQFINQHSEIDAIEFSASKEQGLSRTRLYSAMVDKLSQGTDWINAKTISKADKSVENADTFKLVRRSAVNDKMTGIDENFADGKKKGKSRPGRVKRSGASCNGSVTELRAKAKKASGERAKMYHWCANMKSGKKK
jgi:hypothetical protein